MMPGGLGLQPRDRGAGGTPRHEYFEMAEMNMESASVPASSSSSPSCEERDYKGLHALSF